MSLCVCNTKLCLTDSAKTIKNYCSARAIASQTYLHFCTLCLSCYEVFDINNINEVKAPEKSLRLVPA
jgi:hypothetical protein